MSMDHSFKEVILILTVKIPDKPYVQADLGLYFSRVSLKDGKLIWGCRGSTEKARTKLSVSTKSVQSKTKRKKREDGVRLNDRSLSKG